MRSSSEFSEGSFKVIIYEKLLRFNDIYGVSAQSGLQRTNVHWPIYCIAMSTVSGTLPAHCNLLHYHSFGGSILHYDAASTLD